MLKLPPLSLYIHIPWCIRKCPYCDFNSHQAAGDIPEADYVTALIKDMQTDKAFVDNRKIHSVFFGGGTPSLFSASAIADIIQAATEIYGLEDSAEVTLEANPGTAEYKNFSQLGHAGVNRLSMGVQSFNDLHLQKLGRIHSSDNIYSAYQFARDGGINNINLDLMHGLPGQTLAEAINDLEKAIALKPEHISWYQLTIEPNTVFYNKPPTLPIEDTLADIQDAGEALLGENGFKQYEVSAYASDNTLRSAHNLNYWQFGDYLGIGAGAHGKITQKEGILRYNKTRLPNDYLDPTKKFTASEQYVANENLPLEFMMNAMRLVDGVPTQLFEERTRLPLTVIEQKLTTLKHKGLLEKAPERITTTTAGARFLNEVLAEFM